MKCYVVFKYCDKLYIGYEKIRKDYQFIKNYHYKSIPTIFKGYCDHKIIYNRHQIEFNDLTEFCSFINDCLSIRREVIVKRIDDELYFIFKIY